MSSRHAHASPTLTPPPVHAAQSQVSSNLYQHRAGTRAFASVGGLIVALVVLGFLTWYVVTLIRNKTIALFDYVTKTNDAGKETKVFKVHPGTLWLLAFIIMPGLIAFITRALFVSAIDAGKAAYHVGNSTIHAGR